MARGKGDGSIYYRQDRGIWEGALISGWRDGKPIRRRVTGSSKAKAAARLRKLRDELREGPRIGTTHTVETWMNYWLETGRKHWRPRTYAGYRSVADQYTIPLLGHHRLPDLMPEHIEQAWDELMEVGNPVKSARGTARPLSSTTAHNAHANLRTALGLALRREHVTRNVATLIQAPPVADADINAMSMDEARAVLDYCANADMRNAARWTVALSLGLRQGEALGLTWPDVDLEAGTMDIRRALLRLRDRGLVLGPVKSKAARRSLVLPAPLLAQMRAHRKRQAEERIAAGSTWWAGEESYVFSQVNGRPIDPRADWRGWRDLLVAAGVDHYRLHDARHTAATLLLLQGVKTRVAMDILGHSQASMTHRYEHVMDEMKRDAAERMGAALWG